MTVRLEEGAPFAKVNGLAIARRLAFTLPRDWQEERHMAKAWPTDHTHHDIHRARPRDWRKAMSDNVAYALLVYTALQIFVTMHALKGGAHGTALPYLALIVLVAAIIPACRWFEKRWEALDDEAAADPQLRPLYRRDQLFLWLIAIGLPFALTGLFKLATGAL